MTSESVARPGQRVRAALARPPRAWRSAEWLIFAGYLLAAIAIGYHFWPHPQVLIPTASHTVQSDILLNVWLMRYAAAAVAHGHLPALATTALNWPQGVNMMWNPSMLLPGVVLTPITLLAGPVASLAVLMTVGFAGSAAAMYVVLRRWGASMAAAAVGGAFYGFSPALRMTAVDHYQLQFAVLLPLIVDAALRLLTGRGRPVRTGIWLGVLTAAQVFTGEELLADAALAGLLIAIVAILSRPRQVRAGLDTAVPGFGVAAVVTVLLAGRALWVQIVGPLAEHGSPWHLAKYGNPLTDFVSAPVGMMLHGSGAYSGPGLAEHVAYLGWPLLVVLVAGTAWCWRDIRVRAAGVTFVVLEVLSLGGHQLKIGPWNLPGAALPWHWLANLPLVGQAVPNRLSILADGAAAVVLALVIDRARTAMPAASRWARPAVLGAAALVLVPVIPRAIPTISVPALPAGWQQVVASLHLPPGAPVLVLPLSTNGMAWQAMTSEDISIVSGYCIAPATRGNVAGLPPGHGAQCGTITTFTSYQRTTKYRFSHLAAGASYGAGPGYHTFLSAIREWHPAAVITFLGNVPVLRKYLHNYFGVPSARAGSVVGWRLLRGWYRSHPAR